MRLAYPPFQPAGTPLNSTIISISNVSKVYASGHQALHDISLEIQRGEIFALLGPNGAGKTTLINGICGLVNLTQGQVTINGFDHVRDYRQARASIGLVPQELTAEAFEKVWNTVSYSRGLFGKRPDPALIEKILKSLSLWDKRNSRMLTLSGGMKRRVLIAKALSHEPAILFLDEPTAGVDVELRKGMWDVIRELKNNGVTIILTTHYIEEAEEMADRIGVIRQGRLILVENKHTLMRSLGKKELAIELQHPITALPAALKDPHLGLSADGRSLIYTYDSQTGQTAIASLLNRLYEAGVAYTDLQTRQSSLEDIFVDLIKEDA